jgi:hypothetical protein
VSSTLIIAFETLELRTLCETQAAAEEELGVEVAAKLRGRLADLRASANVTEMPTGNPMFGDVEVSVDLSDRHILRFRSNHAKPPQDSQGAIDWKRVNRVRIVGIDGPNED